MSRRRGGERAGRSGRAGDGTPPGADEGRTFVTVQPVPPAPRRTAEPGRGDPRPDAGPAPSTPATARVAAAALLPLRFFFGITFLYAGIDKLIDPTFFNAADPASIQAQLAEFVRVSPIAPLVHLSEPFAVPVGVLIALAEIAIGLGALTGLAYRLAAAAGAALSIVFFLTASWTTRPYYYGPDLPYAVGWLTLALAGHAGLLVPQQVLDLGRSAADRRRRGWVPGAPPGRLDRRTRPAEDEGIVSRRTVLQVGVLGVATLALASATMPVRLIRGSSRSGTAGGGPGPAPTPAGGPTPAPTADPASGSLQVAQVSNVPKGGALPFTVPIDAPASLPAGDPALIVQLPSGAFVAYDAVCTHEGCTVEWAGQESVLVCPCHGAAFDAANDGQVLQGPARRPLVSLPLVVDEASGTISLQA
jgi:thiosulfate dehydrogenase [quinone] large subunit